MTPSSVVNTLPPPVRPPFVYLRTVTPLYKSTETYDTQEGAGGRGTVNPKCVTYSFLTWSKGQVGEDWVSTSLRPRTLRGNTGSG